MRYKYTSPIITCVNHIINRCASHTIDPKYLTYGVLIHPLFLPPWIIFYPLLTVTPSPRPTMAKLIHIWSKKPMKDIEKYSPIFPEAKAG